MQRIDMRFAPAQPGACRLARFLTLWKDADPDIPTRKQAKSEYVNLQWTRPRCRRNETVGDGKIIAHADHHSGHLASDNPADSDPPDPIPQKVGGSLQLGCHQPHHQPIRSTIAWFRYSYACRAEVRQNLPDARECLSS